MSVAILGVGKLGAAVATLLSRAGQDVVVWDVRQSAVVAVTAAIPGTRGAATSQDASSDARIVVFAVPTHALRDVASHVGDVAHGDQIALHACRGVDVGFKLPHQVIREDTCLKKIGVLGGPLYFDDAPSGRPLVMVLASRFDDVQRAIKHIAAPTKVRVHSTRDVIGVEVCGAISNVSQIAAGIAEGLGLGETDQGVLLMRGLAEATALGMALGAERATFAGLAGVGDLIPRPVTSMVRHRRLGIDVGAAGSATDLVKANADIEGLTTVREARTFAVRHGLALPLVEAVHAILHEGAPPRETLEHVLSKDLDVDVAA